MMALSSPVVPPPLLNLPDVALQHTCAFLDAPDLLTLLSSHRDLYRLGHTASFWTNLMHNNNNNNNTDSNDGNDNGRPVMSALDAKRAFLKDAYCRRLPAVRWLPLLRSPRTPSAREGHLSCRLGNCIVLTGGFADDRAVHVRQLHSHQHDWESLPYQQSSGSPCFAYGASLTPLDNHRAIRFGGFRSGGYSGECSQLALLTIENDNNGDMTARWDNIQGNHQEEEQGLNTEAYLARAYHTATLIRKRYLLILGGMQSRGSIWNPALLDTHTWTWIKLPSVVGTGVGAPSPRHGHTVIHDLDRKRLVLFGGGNGSDLLRSGQDNAEVWQLSLTQNILGSNMQQQGEWEWVQLHPCDQNQNRESVPLLPNQQQLSAAEKLCLGRCHVAHRVSSETALLVFGGGRPSTNSLLAYNLKKDIFFRPPKVLGPLPMPRFTCASVFLQDSCTLFVHGGYATQQSSELGDMVLLDLAPTLDQRGRLPSFAAINPHAPSHAPVIDQHVQDQQRQRGRVLMEPYFFQMLLGRAAEGDREILRDMYDFLDHSHGDGGINNLDDSSSSEDDDDVAYMPLDAGEQNDEEN